MQEGLLLLVHGEVTDPAVDFFDREKVFIETKLKPLLERLPELRVVLEHITTRDAAEFVAAGPASLAASVTPQHLLLNRNALFLVHPLFRGVAWHDVQGWRLHALPLLGHDCLPPHSHCCLWLQLCLTLLGRQLGCHIDARKNQPRRAWVWQGGLRPHAFCLPILKREEHRAAVLAAATSGNTRFFLGTDSAPHAKGAKVPTPRPT